MVTNNPVPRFINLKMGSHHHTLKCKQMSKIVVPKKLKCKKKYPSLYSCLICELIIRKPTHECCKKHNMSTLMMTEIYIKSLMGGWGTVKQADG